MALTRIYIEAADDGDWFEGYGDDSSDGTYILLVDDKTLMGVVKKLKLYAVEHGVQFIEMQTDIIPD